MKIGKKFLIYLFCGFLTFSVVSSSYYKTVHAFEYVGGALAFEEAFKWLLATIGITATAGMTDAYWDAYGDDFVDYAVQNGATQNEVAEWQLKACEGILDKGSEVWDSFKDWANNLVKSDSGSGGGGVTATYSSFSNCFNAVKSYTVGNTVYGFGDFNCYCVFTDHIFTYFGITPGVYSIDGNHITCSSDNFILLRMIFDNQYRDYTAPIDQWTVAFNNNNCFDNTIKSLWNMSYNNLAIGVPHIYGITATGSVETTNVNFKSVTKNITNLNVISSTGVNESDDEVAIPYPGVSDSDNTLANDTYQDIVDKINDGTITQEQGIEQIQELLRVITYDTVTDEVVPPQKNDDGTNKTKDEVLKDNKENTGFTLAGLENVFPFCIPFDIYAFMTLLVADPVSPEFDFPIKTVNGHEETIHVDLEPFEPVAVVVRYVFDFLFIVGLAMLTRSLIGGGSSD